MAASGLQRLVKLSCASLIVKLQPWRPQLLGRRQRRIFRAVPALPSSHGYSSISSSLGRRRRPEKPQVRQPCPWLPTPAPLWLGGRGRGRCWEGEGEGWRSTLLSLSLREVSFLRSMAASAQREGLWRTRNMGREAVEVAQELVWAKGEEKKIRRVMDEKGRRLVKVDMLMVLEVLFKQDCWWAALKMFELVKQEPWYKPDFSLYNRLIDCLAKGQQPELALQMMQEMEQSGCPPHESMYAAIIASYCRAERHKEGLKFLREVVQKEKGMRPFDSSYRVLIEACERGGAGEEAEGLKREREELKLSGVGENVPVQQQQQHVRITRKFSK